MHIRIPVELIQQIIEQVAKPIRVLEFGHHCSILQTLHQLRLTSHTVNNISTPFLYSSVVIAGYYQLYAFLRLSSALHRHCHTLRLCKFSSHSVLPSLIADLLRALSPKLRRLALDVPGSQLAISAPVREALKSCVYIEDYIISGYSPMQLFPPPFYFSLGWTALHRLVLDGPLVDDAFSRSIAQLPNLTHLATIEPRWRYSDDGTEVAAFLDLLNTARGLQQLLLIYCEATEFCFSSLKRLKAGVKRLSDNLDVLVYYEIMAEMPPKPMNLIRVRIGDGTFWELDSKNLLLLAPVS